MMNLEQTNLKFDQLPHTNSTSDYLVYNTFQTSDRANYTTTTTGDTMTIRDIMNDNTIILWRPIYKVDELMDTAKISESEEGRAVRLPADFHFEDSEALAKRQGETVVLVPKEVAWQTFLHGLNGFSDDFMADGRPPEILNVREEF